jgi:hypothetical protein
MLPENNTLYNVLRDEAFEADETFETFQAIEIDVAGEADEPDAVAEAVDLSKRRKNNVDRKRRIQNSGRQKR